MSIENKKAVALKYERYKDNAPKVVAKGKGEIAKKIIEVAKQHGIYIKEDPDLVEVLSGLDLYEEIPEDLYKVVAEILAFIYKAKQKR
ncbi:MAG TPA: flagellar biosynthesis protein FlhB [Sulfurihydrogenibium azorense]|uniref:Flagellar biosynthesis protein FlhB n=1 Tax=Sulfurihydrogenibium azorense TaxID=309806 RepID=A0A831YCR7_9AQUI|nr:MAG: flagellar biosynthesis protein FlhB [Sulfurihydrogenibium sp.]HEV08820.1 flagellar biosynthesis protein FlhB [Sulfurihydrogenibium azorense]